MEPETHGQFSRSLLPEGKVTRWPKKERERRSVAEYLQSKFAKGRRYSETEVNAILGEWHTFNDHALLRRELFERRLIERRRDGGAYWVETEEGA